ncbi:MAG TPA: glycerophosphodiester phosphodiesterase [Abditibacteriaceae bacterium]|jgi:glycerophosphoryl diester phosphodiesterase
MLKFWMLVLSLFLFRGVHAVEIIAHRGASHDAPENTIAACKLGWQQGAESVELDIHQSKDGKIIVMHDADTKRTAGLDKKIVEQTLEEIRVLEAGSWKGAGWKGEPIPTLDEVLPLIPQGKRLVIEIKCGPEILPELQRVLKASGRGDKEFVIIGFGYDTMKQAKQMFPTIPIFYLSNFKKNKETGAVTPSIEELITKAKAAHLDGLNLHHSAPLDQTGVQKIKDAGLQIYFWTVDDAIVARRLQEMGAQGLTTNRPAWLRQQLKH